MALQESVLTNKPLVVPLIVPTGKPLRLYLTKGVCKRSGAPVASELPEPVFAFDRELIPARILVLGTVSRPKHIPNLQGITAIWNGVLSRLGSIPSDELVNSLLVLML